jgi:RNA polymerase sigma-70 factor (ECF subfamily)
MADYGKYIDHELLLLLKQGNVKAFSAVYDRYFELLFRHALSMLKDEEAVKDVIQNVFARLWEMHESIEIHTSLSSYLYASTRHGVLKIIRHSKVEERFFNNLQQLPLELNSPVEEFLREAELRRIIEAEIIRLPPKMREVFTLSRIHDNSHREIAERLNLSENTVKRQVSNALFILRKKLKCIAPFLVNLI